MMETKKSPVSCQEGWATGFYEEKWRLMALFFIPHHLLNLLCISEWNDFYTFFQFSRLSSVVGLLFVFVSFFPFSTNSLLLSLPFISSLF